jgi:hypothetical protein
MMPFKEAIARQQMKHAYPENAALLRRRKTIVEPIFAYIKRILSFRRWTIRGLDNVQAQWSLLCTAVNLRKMYTAWAKTA